MNNPAKRKSNSTKIGSQAIHGAKWSLLGQWSRLGSQMISIVILARLLSPEDYGLFGVVAAIAGFATVIGDFGLSSASIQAKSISHQQRSNLLWINLFIGTVSGIVLASFAPLLGQIFENETITNISFIMAFNFLLVALTTQFAANVTRGLRFRLLFLGDFLGPLLGLVVAVLCAFSGLGVWSLIIQQLTTNTIIFLILSIGGKWFPSFPAKAPMSGLLSFGSLTFLVQILTYASTNIGALLIGRFQSIPDVGIYGRAQQINSIPSSQLSAPLARVMLPLLSRVQNDLEKLSYYLSRVQNVMAYVIGLIMTFLAIFSDLVVLVALGTQWNEVSPVLAILSIGGFFRAMGFVMQWGFMATGRVGIQLSFSIFTRSIMMVMLVFSAQFGILAVAGATSLGLIFNWGILYFIALPKTGISTKLLAISFFRPLITHSLVVLVCLIVKSFFVESSLSIVWQWSILFSIFLFTYLLIMVFVKPVRKDINNIMSQLSPLKRR